MCWEKLYPINNFVSYNYSCNTGIILLQKSMQLFHDIKRKKERKSYDHHTRRIRAWQDSTSAHEN